MAILPTGNQSNTSDFNRYSDLLQATVSGGLNIVDTALTIDGSDSPDLLNVDIEIDGSIAKRRGFSYEPGIVIPSGANFVTSLQLKNKYNVLVFQSSVDLYIVHRDLNATTFIYSAFKTITMFNVFGTNGGISSTTDIVISNEPKYTKVLMLKPKHTPVQLLAIEASSSFIVAGASTNVITIQVPELYYDYDFTLGNAIAWVDGVVNNITNFVYSGGNGTFTFATAIPSGNHTLEAVYFTVQFWSEGNKIDVTQAIQQVSQGVTEKHKAIPSVLLREIDMTPNYGDYPIRVHLSTNYDDICPPSLVPAGANQFSFSLGSDVPAATPYSPSPFFVSFGAVPAAARGIFFIRGYSLKNYNAGQLVNDNQLSVCLYNDKTQWFLDSGIPPSQGGAGAGGGKYSFTTELTSWQHPGATPNRVGYISFDATSTASGGIGLPQDDILLYGVYKPNAYTAEVVGSIYLQQIDLRKPYHRSPFVVFGIQDLCQYSSSGSSGAYSFPSTGCIFQRRLCLSGISGATNLIAFSEIQDTTIPGQYYRNFQTTLEDGARTNGFIILLPTDNNERIVSMREFQGSLFVWTNLSVYRINGIQGVPFSDGNFDINKIAAVGCINPRSVTVTSNSMYWLSQSGVYAMKANDTSGGYSVVELSAKVRPAFVNDMSAYPELAAFLTYDNVEQKLYVGIPSKRYPFYNITVLSGLTPKPYESDTLFVYHEQRDGWTKYSDMGGLNFYARGMVVEYTQNSFSNSTSESTGASNLYVYGSNYGGMLIGKQPRYIDQTRVYTGVSGSTVYMLTIRYKFFSWVTILGKFTYDPADGVSTDTTTTLKLNKMVSLEDCIVYYNGTELIFNVDYIKTVNGSIQLTFAPLAGKTLYVLPAQRINGIITPMVGLYKNNEPLIAGTDYIVSETTTPDATTTVIVTDVVRVGTTYTAYQVSPVFTRNTILNWKRIKQWAGYYDNTFIGEDWKASTVGTRYDLIGLHKNFVNFDIAFMFNSEQDGYYDSEIYNSAILEWDEAQLSLGGASQSYKQYSRLSVPIIGGGVWFSVHAL